MPELPDVEGFKRYLDATALHQPVRRTSVRDPRILEGVSARELAVRIKGRAFTSTDRHGKYLFAELTKKGGWVVMHFGMTGELSYAVCDDPPQYTRVLFEFEDRGHLAYLSRRMLGHVGYTADLEAFKRDRELGPDALADKLDSRALGERLAGRSGAIKSILMDQSVIAGLGNIWADEVLFQARLHPEIRVNMLTEEQLDRLDRAMRRVLRQGARVGGTIEKLPRRYLLPHRDDGGRCPRCGGAIQRLMVSGRATHLCPDCQPLKSPTRGATRRSKSA